MDGKENHRSKMITWLRSRDCDNIDDDSSKQRLIEREIRRDPYRGIKWKLNTETDCFSICGGGFCPSYCGANGFCCSGDQSLNGNCPKSALESFRDIAPYPFGRHYCMTPGKNLSEIKVMPFPLLSHLPKMQLVLNLDFTYGDPIKQLYRKNKHIKLLWEFKTSCIVHE